MARLISSEREVDRRANHRNAVPLTALSGTLVKAGIYSFPGARLICAEGSAYRSAMHHNAAVPYGLSGRPELCLKQQLAGRYLNLPDLRICLRNASSLTLSRYPSYSHSHEPRAVAQISNRGAVFRDSRVS